jgi:hypothetical protein
MSDITNSKLPIKTVIGLIFWFGSVAGVYFKMQSSVDKALEIAQAANDNSKDLLVKWNNSNINILTYRVDELTKSMDELKKSTDEVKTLLRAIH